MEDGSEGNVTVVGGEYLKSGPRRYTTDVTVVTWRRVQEGI